MDVSKVPLSPGGVCSLSADGVQVCLPVRGGRWPAQVCRAQVSLSLWVLLSGSGEQPVAFLYCWYEGKSVGAAMGTGKCSPVNGLLPQCHVTEGHKCSLPWNRD